MVGLAARTATLDPPGRCQDYWAQTRWRRFLASSFNALLIDRKEIKVHQSPVELMIKEIGDIYSLIVFPEGSRAEDGRWVIQKWFVLPGQKATGLGTGACLHGQHESYLATRRVLAGTASKQHHDRATHLARKWRAEKRLLEQGSRVGSCFERSVTHDRLSDNFLLGTVLVTLAIASLVGRWLRRQPSESINPALVRRFRQRLNAWWLMTAIMVFGLLAHRAGTVIMFGLVSFWAMREFITMAPTRRSDHTARCSWPWWSSPRCNTS